MDVGHPMLAVFTSSELQTLQNYADRAEHVFRGLLQRLLARFETDSTVIPKHEISGADQEAKQTIENMRQWSSAASRSHPDAMSETTS
jgi:hypothetical protein